MFRPPFTFARIGFTACSITPPRMAWAVLLLSLIHTVRAGLMDDHARAVEALRRPQAAVQAVTGAFSVPLACGRLDWEGGRCRMLALPLGEDTLLVLELNGRGVLHLEVADSLEALSARASLGRRWQRQKVREVCLVTRRLPKPLGELAWAKAGGSLPFLPPRPFFGRRRLERLHPDNPLMSRWPGPDPLWLCTSPDDWVLRQREDGWRLSRPLHEGSRIEALAFQSPQHLEVAWLAPTFHAWPAVADSQVLRVEKVGGNLRWQLDLWHRASTLPLLLMVDPASTLNQAYGTKGDLKAMLPVDVRRDGPWLVVEADSKTPGDRLRLRGHTPAVRVRENTARRMACSGANWFPRLPWWEKAIPTRVEDPGLVLGFSGKASWSAALDGRAPQLLLPLPAHARVLTEDLTLCWTPLAEQAARHRSTWTPPPKHTGAIEDLSLRRDRDVRPPGHEAAAEPVDLAQGQDSLSAGMLGEDGGALLAAAAERLREWLGSPLHGLRIWERSQEGDRNDEREALRLHDAPPGAPLEVSTRDLRSGDAAAQLRMLETLCLGWWEAPNMESAAEARWLILGAARACALRLLEDLRGAEWPADLRREALRREAAAFQPMAFASLPVLGDRAEGSWHSAEVQDRLAWRFALLMEHLRWRLRDPITLQDTLYQDFLRDWRLRRQEAMAPRRPLDDLATALGGVLVGEESLETCAFDGVTELRAWLDAQWRQASLPEAAVEIGRVDTAEGPRLLLRVQWEDHPPASTVLPVLLDSGGALYSYALRCTAREEQFLLPLDPDQLMGVEVAPGGCMPAHLTVNGRKP